MLEDAELRGLLRAEGNERLAKMEEALLQLEADPADAAAIDELFRHAHSLKGAARMAELDELATRAHALEDALSEHRSGKPVGRDDASAVLHTIDGMRALLAAATEERRPTKRRPSARAPSEADAGLRVDTTHLDRILDLSGELAVVRHRLDRHTGDVVRLVQAWHALAESSATPAARAFGVRLDALRAEAERDHARLTATAARLEESIQQLRLTSLEAAIGPLRRAVRDVATTSGKAAAFEVEGGDTRLDKRVLDGVKDALMHLVRNAVDHGLELPADRLAAGKRAEGQVRLRASREGSDVLIELSDDGRGFDLQAIRTSAVRKGLATAAELQDAPPERILDLVFLPGFTTASAVTGISGRGVGLDVVRDAARRLHGTCELVSRPGEGATFRLRFPATRSAERVLVVRAAGRAYALPVEAIDRVERIETVDEAELAALRAVPLATLLSLPSDALPGILVALVSGSSRSGVLVEAVIGEEDVVVKPHSSLLRRVPNVAGAALLDSGDICIVLEAGDVVANVRRRSERPRLLVVDDSPVIRQRVMDLMCEAGYDVTSAEDGLEALALAASGEFSAIVSDVEMPRMDGFTLVRRLREDPRHAALPIVLLTTLGSDAARARGKEAGASAYVKKGPDAGSQLEAELRRLLKR